MPRESLVFKPNLSERDFRRLLGRKKEPEGMNSKIYSTISVKSALRPVGFDRLQEFDEMGIQEHHVDSSNIPYGEPNTQLDNLGDHSTFSERSKKTAPEATGDRETESEIPTPPSALGKWVDLMLKIIKLGGAIAGGIAGLNYFGLW